MSSYKQDAVLSQGRPRDAAVNFDTYRTLQQHRAVFLPQHAFIVGLCLQTAVNYLSKVKSTRKNQSDGIGLVDADK